MKVLLSSILLVAVLFKTDFAKAVETDLYVSFSRTKGAFPLNDNGKTPSLLTAENEWPGVIRAFKSFAEDLRQVSGTEPFWINEAKNAKGLVIIAGTIGHNKVIDELIRLKKIDVSGVNGKWESSLTQVVSNPLPGVAYALVIAGSDKRGTIYGIYTLSAQMGVSPWYWWADVPAKKNSQIYVSAGKHIFNEPAVKYRGIFLNDEAPALTGWAREKFGGLNHQFYEKVFELILRLKGNYLWPAMWGNAFNDDDKLNPILADEYGIVMGTSHHEPMQRAQQEWKRFGKGEWNYQTNEANLKQFWRDGIVNMGNHESIVTLAMRGDGDEPMTEGTATALLERIVKDQREIITDVTKKPASETPQLWALYKEVQDYYDKGMRVPDDVTLLLCDDNWGNIRKLPQLNAAPRKGGYGIYYHFDYVGGPRSYRWLNTNPISKVREQMNLAYKYGADQIWIVNVGDLKPMEFPTEFFLDYALDPDKWPADKIQNYTERWVSAQFGDKYVKEIAEIIDGYTQINGRRKPELLSPTSYSLVNYNEFENVVVTYNHLLSSALSIEAKLPENYKDAFFELVLHPVQACANLNEMYYTVAKNELYASQKRTATNTMAQKAKILFQNDKDIAFRYNEETANGKWPHMMDQTHIGYTSWDNPREDIMPEVKTITLSATPDFGIAIVGSVDDLTLGNSAQKQLQFDFYTQKNYVEIFNKSIKAFDFEVDVKEPWLKASIKKDEINDEKRIWFEADWNQIPEGKHLVPITVKAMDKSFTVYAAVNKAPSAVESKPNYLPSNAYLSLDAENFSTSSPKRGWEILPHYGRTNSGITAVPVNSPSQPLDANSPYVAYEINSQDAGPINLNLYLSPTIDFLDKGGLLFAISFDDEKPQIINLNENDNERTRDRLLANSIKQINVKHDFKTAGKHTLKFWRIDAGVVLQKIVIDSGGLATSYLGAPVQNNTNIK
ncbi:glycosyl hydrolase 115 family protein [Pedobacter alpinus]|uniref:Glycosyl hydrolase 115 family protein n=1 Tax=Pedobacter alpinus TaxID=1590643 RepID=A0ABW5TV14_9SPHI